MKRSDLTKNCWLWRKAVTQTYKIIFPKGFSQLTRKARYHTFVEIDHEIISTVILLPFAESFKKGCCPLQAKVCAQITG